MTRGNARELALHLIYAQEFTGEPPLETVNDRLKEEYRATLAGEYPLDGERTYIDRVVAGVADKQEELNEHIRSLSKGWDLRRISRITRAVLQLSMYEILFEEDVPTGVSISEAVRLAKLYDSEEAGSFVNGILGTFARSLTEAKA